MLCLAHRDRVCVCVCVCWEAPVRLYVRANALFICRTWGRCKRPQTEESGLILALRVRYALLNPWEELAGLLTSGYWAVYGLVLGRVL